MIYYANNIYLLFALKIVLINHTFRHICQLKLLYLLCDCVNIINNMISDYFILNIYLFLISLIITLSYSLSKSESVKISLI